MNWRDLLYFSKGERRALTLLLCLITTSWIILLLTDNKAEPAEPATNNYMGTPTPAQKPQKIVAKTAKPANTKISPSEGGKSFVPTKQKFHPDETKKTSRKTTFPKAEKYPVGTVVELNAADTTILKKVPGIGSTFARRIVKYRELLGGFYSVAQLSEVYGIDEERYNTMKSWFSVDISKIRHLSVHEMSIKELCKHPYINYKQARIIEQLRKQKGKLSGWENLQLLEEFTETDKERLTPYLSFE